MASNVTVKECGVCNEEFDEEGRCPRIFQCSHTICTSCIDQLIRNNAKQCPYCRRNFKASCSKDITVNHFATELIKFISVGNSSPKMSPKHRVPPRKKGIEDIKKETRETSSLHFVSCLEAQKHIEKTIKEVINLQKSIKQENTRIENDVLPKIQNIVVQNNGKLDELERTKIKLEDQLQEVKGNERELDDVKENLDSCTANTFTEIAALLDKAEETNAAIGCWIETFKELISEEEKTLPITEKAIERTREKINIIFEVLSSGEEGEGETDISPTMAAMAIQEEEDNSPTPISLEILRKMNTHVKRLVEQGRVYSIQHRNGRRRSARISYPENEKLCLHHLKEEPLPPNALVVDHGEVLSLVDPLTRLTFMDLGVGGSTLGRIYIRLHADNKRAKQFSFLCTGETGPSYANTNILEVKCDSDGNDVFVHGGDYETNDGEGGKALVPGVMEEVDIWMYTSLPMGSVTAGSESEATIAQFKIYIRDDLDYQSASFGMVEEGLSVLTEIISHHSNIREVYIKDCGIVLPLTIPVTRPVQ